MIRFEFFVHSTVPHSQAVAERLRSQLAQEQGVASSPTAPILLGDVYAAVLQMIRDATAKGASSIATSLHHTVYATAVLLPLAQRPPSTVAASSSQLGGHHVPMRPPIVLPNSDTMLRSTKTCETEDSGTRESTCSVGHIDRTLAAFCRPLLGNVHTSCGSPFHVRIGITVASKRSEAATDDPSAKKAYTERTEWMLRFVAIVEKVRLDIRKPDQVAVLILDQASQHIIDDELLKKHNIRIVLVPKKCTHVFQPADQFVISGLKQLARKKWYAIITSSLAEGIREKRDVDTLTDEILQNRTKYRRKNKVQCLVEAALEISKEQVRKSWFASGVMRAAFGLTDPKTPVVYDSYKESLETGVVFKDAIEVSDSGEEDEGREKKAEPLLPVTVVQFPPGYDLLCSGPEGMQAITKAKRRVGRPPAEPTNDARKADHKKKKLQKITSGKLVSQLVKLAFCNKMNTMD